MIFVTITRSQDVNDGVIERLREVLKIAVPSYMEGVSVIGGIQINDAYFGEFAWNNPPIHVSIVGQQLRKRHRERDAAAVARGIKGKLEEREVPRHHDCDVFVTLVKEIGVSYSVVMA